MFPNLLAIDEAKSIEIADIMLVIEKREPSFSSLRLNFSWKKKVTQELDIVVSGQTIILGQVSYREARPDAKASRANSRQRLITMTRLSWLISGSKDLKVDLFGLLSWVLSPSSGAVSVSATGIGCFFSASHALLRASAKRSLINPMAAYPQNTAL